LEENAMELDDVYANGAYIKGAETYPPRWTAAAAALREQLGKRARLAQPYGESGRQEYDLFLPNGAPKGTVIFLHGGYWRLFDRSFFSHLAIGTLARGWAVAMPSYDLCPDVRICQITRQIVQAVQTIAARTDGPISITGHSAGGQLAARMLDKALMPAGVADRLTHVLPISPLSDLRPLRRTVMNADFHMLEAEAIAESPMLMHDRHDIPVTVWVGADERPAFLDQARWLANAWHSDMVVAPNTHHFNVIDPLTDPDSDMVRCLTSTG
jgi:arylformamidase